jgi:hypothetical protein
MDEFYGKKGDGYDYSSQSTRHREQRHHLEGMHLAGDSFARKYGEKFRWLAMIEAQRHIMDDIGRIPEDKGWYMRG